MSTWHDQAICLDIIDYSETSQVVTVLTGAHGLLTLLAKGAKRQTRKGFSGSFSGPLDFLAGGEVLVLPARQPGAMGLLSGWELLQPRRDLRGHLPAYYAAALLADVTLTLLPPGDVTSTWLRELEAALTLLPHTAPARVVLSYLKFALAAAGYALVYDRCMVTGRMFRPGEMVRLDPQAGGIVACTPAQRDALPSGIVTALQRLTQPTGLDTAQLQRPVTPSAALAALDLLCQRVETVSDRALRSRRWGPEIVRETTS